MTAAEQEALLPAKGADAPDPQVPCLLGLGAYGQELPQAACILHDSKKFGGVNGQALA
jgi:hypothetical protein